MVRRLRGRRKRSGLMTTAQTAADSPRSTAVERYPYAAAAVAGALLIDGSTPGPGFLGVTLGRDDGGLTG